MDVFIQGGGGSDKSFELDRLFANQLNKQKPLLYIPIAINYSKYPPEKCYEWITGTFHPLGISKIEMWLEQDFTNDFNCLKQYSGIYIGGGNTFKLIQILRKTGYANEIKKLIAEDLPVYGGSAGGIIMAKTIYPALSADENNVGITDFNGLNVVRDYDLWFHYTQDQKILVKEYLKKYSLNKLLALPENAGLHVTNNSLTVIGPGSVEIFPEEKLLTHETEI